MIKPRFAFVLMCFSAVSAFAMPSRSDLKKVQPAVNELMAEDIAAMKKGKLAPDKVAETAMGYASEATDEASKFLFYKGAFGLYVQGRKYDDAVKAVEALTREVKNVPDKVVADIIREKLKRVSKKDGGAVFELYDRVDRRMRSMEELAKLEAALKANPKDVDARRKLAFAKGTIGDWAGALADFALVDGKASEAVKAEQGGKAAAAADLWWNLSDDEDELAVLRAHAAALYRQAMEGGKLDGIKLALAKKRVAEFGGGVPQEEKPAVAARKDVASAKAIGEVTKAGVQPSSAPLPVIAPSRVKYNWSIPAGKKRKTMEIDLGGEKLTLLGVPGGTYDKTEVTRPFWIAIFPLSAKQCRCLDPDFKADDSDLEELFANDDDVHVASRMRYSKTVRFFEILNAKFGEQLPKGWVIRPPTLAEALVAIQDRATRDHPMFPVDHRRALAACQQKGRYQGVKSLSQLSVGERSSLGRVYFDYRQRCREGVVMTYDLCHCVDRLHVPAKYQHIMDMWQPGYRQFWDVLVKPNIQQKNPLLYTESDDPKALYVFSVTGRCTPSEWWGSCMSMCVAVGPDYVAEWKAKNGK